MSGNTETIGELFEYAIALERAAETLYKQLEKMFSDHPEVALFWKRYAGEEHAHASYLERMRTRMDTSRLPQQADVSMLQNARHLLEITTPDRLVGVQTLEDAYQLATELENSEVNAIFEFMIVNFSTDELEQSHFLREQLSSHIERLEIDFPTQYNNSAARQKVLILEKNSDTG